MRGRIALGVLIAVALAGASQAQPQQRTTVTIQDDPHDCADRGVFGGCSIGEVKAAKKARTLRQEVGAAAADGRCEDAVKIALKAGDFDLAERTKSLCSGAPGR